MQVSEPDPGALNRANLEKAGEVGAAAAAESLARGSKASQSGSASRGDEVQLSKLGQQLRAEESTSPERTAKLAKLQAAVAAGSYQIDAPKLANRLIDDAISVKG